MFIAFGNVYDVCIAVINNFYVTFADPDSEVTNFAKRTVKDLKLPSTFVAHISQSIQVSGTLL